MEFSVLAFLFTIGCCLISWVIAGKTAIKNEYKEWFEKLNHPKNPFMLKYMNIVGVAFYLLFGYVLYQLFVSNEIVPIIITVVILLLNGLSPFFMYKTKNLKLIFFTFLVIPILVSVLTFLLIQTNLILAIPVIVYLLWLIFEMSYFYRLMKLNK
jgi:tryptophan-rich sensory protein